MKKLALVVLVVALVTAITAEAEFQVKITAIGEKLLARGGSCEYPAQYAKAAMTNTGAMAIIGQFSLDDVISVEVTHCYVEWGNKNIIAYAKVD